MTTPAVEICHDSAAVAAKTADLVIRASQAAIRRRGRCTLVLAGGSTPEQTYRLLAERAAGTGVDWARTYVFFGDERFVPPDDARSNFGMARRTLLAQVAIPADQVFPIPTHGRSAAESAVAYTADLARCFGTDADGPPPCLDLILLGLGDDGHTASLFPGAAALQVRSDWVTWSPPGVLPPPVDRITLTYPVLNAAREIIFVVAGRTKAAAMRDVLEGHAPREQRPAAGVQPSDGTVTWVADADAASLLARSQTGAAAASDTGHVAQRRGAPHDAEQRSGRNLL